MTDKETEKLIDNKIRELIEQSLKELSEEKVNMSYAEKVFDQVLRNNNELAADENMIEVTYEELVNEVKHGFIKKHGAWLEKEISELKKRLEL